MITSLLVCTFVATLLIGIGTLGLRRAKSVAGRPAAVIALALAVDAVHVAVILAGVAVLLIGIAQPLGDLA